LEAFVTQAIDLSPKAIAAALRHAWLPVARAIDVAKPKASDLLGERLVVFRRQDGSAAVTDRRCIHRSGDLAAGTVKGTAIVCPYHGWQFDGTTGACTAIPSLGLQRKISSNVHIKAYPVMEKYGLIWICLDTPMAQVPILPEMDELGMSYIVGQPVLVRAGIVASIDNFQDFAHFPFLHFRSMGAVPYEIEPLEVRTEGYEIFLTRTYSVSGAGAGTYGFDEGISIHYHAVMPSLVSGRFDYGSKGQRAIMECFQPLGESGCIIYNVSGTTKNYTVTSPELASAEEDSVLAEDKPILDSLWPPEAPLDRSVPEFSVAADRLGLATRGAFVKFVSYVQLSKTAKFAQAPGCRLR
jgi:nitrite reductase/ring-hydroxylating ferredoxin subunit